MKQMLDIFRAEIPGMKLGSYTHTPESLAQKIN
jgi:hypothetical protein